jgi:CxxC motif-containing protein (DUF1111 family)
MVNFIRFRFSMSCYVVHALVFFILIMLTACDVNSTNSSKAPDANGQLSTKDVVVPKFDEAEHNTAGGMTTRRLYASYIYPGSKLSRDLQLNFWTGFSLFRDPWVAAPSATGNRDGLGPLFNTRSCVACHTAGSRAKIDEAGHMLPLSLVVRLGSTDANINRSDPTYGDQIQPRAIRYRVQDKDTGNANYIENLGEAWLNKSYNVVSGNFADGTPYELLKPSYELTKLAYGPIASHIGLSVRLAPNVFGLGLLNAIKTEDLLSQEDIDDSDGNQISAKYNRVPNVVTNAIEIGRFGFKAKQPNLRQQVAAAFRDDIGITNSVFPTETCTNKQVACQSAVKFGGHSRDNLEIPDNRFDLTVTFNELLGVPPARRLASKAVQAGRKIFYQSQCQQCHTPSYVTDEDYPVEALANQKIWPYTDLALHDMGEGLADGVYEFDASGREWRTAPLWGIGLQQANTGQQRFMHDGRARTINEAILWHGGEAESSKKTYLTLTKQQRDDLIKFIKAI